MMERYTTLILALSLFLPAWSQGIVTLQDGDGNVVNGSLVRTSALQSTDTVKLYSILNRDVRTEVNVRRYELWPVPGTNNFFCWGVCYLPVASGVNSTWVSQHWIDMAPGATYSDFGAYHEANGLSGNTARYRFVWFALDDPQGPDSSWVDIEFGGAVGLEETPSGLLSAAVYPSPSQGQDVWFEHLFDRWEPGTDLVLYTVLGARLRSIPLQGREGRTLVHTGDLGAGVYFLNVERAGSVLGTRRLVVTR